MSSSTTTGIVDALVDTVSAGLMRVSGSLSEAAVAVEVEGAVGNADVVAVADAAALGFVGVVLTGAGGGIMWRLEVAVATGAVGLKNAEGGEEGSDIASDRTVLIDKAPSGFLIRRFGEPYKMRSCNFKQKNLVHCVM